MRALTPALRAAPLASLLALAAVVAASLARAEGDPAPGPLPLDEAVDDAISALAREVPRNEKPPFLVALAPVTGPGEGESGLGRYVVSRALDRLAQAGVAVVDPISLPALLDADRRRAKGSLGVPPERLAELYLGCRGTIGGQVFDRGGAYELSLRLCDARGIGIASKVERVRKDAATSALLGAPEAPPVALGKGLELFLAPVPQRQDGHGGFLPPAPEYGSPSLLIGDKFQLRIRPSETCYVAVISVQSDGAVQRFFPEGADAKREDARVPAMKELKLPPREGDLWYQLEAPAGTDLYYVVAEREPTLIDALLRIEARPAAPRPPAGSAPATHNPWINQQIAEEGELKGRLEAGNKAFSQVALLRQAFREVADGAPLRDGARPRKVAPEPVPGGPSVPVDFGPDRRVSVPLGRLEGGSFVIHRFEVSSR
jgi:hypothetical protein